MANKNNIEHFNYCIINKGNLTVTLTNEVDFNNVNFIENYVFRDVSFLYDDKFGKIYIDAYEIGRYWTDNIIPIGEMSEIPLPECIRHYKPNWLMKKLFNEKPFDYVRWYYYIRSNKRVMFEILKPTSVIRYF